MSNFKLGQRSLSRLKGVDDRLVAVVKRAIALSEVDFTVLEGLRTVERQKELFAKKFTKTLKSKHIIGHAVDLAVFEMVNGQRNVDWSNLTNFRKIRDAMFAAADELGVKIRWGGDWNRNGKSEDEKFYDGPHFELDY